ncbi:hypothetical protein LshimejAT787_1201870 [Lyophyllum shimeji]|uniref:Uncharacterized protein n=1 Tax=Lyophyllum shimeji TaxID=47721 RepID=A0A9P3PW86_LYOSH|nr:hypothetical protein LshimejAT787_1201870 [Lyophyllum shimeji]
MAEVPQQVIPRTLSLDPVSLSKLPSMEFLLDAGRSVLEASLLWKKGRSSPNAEVFHHRRDNTRKSETWLCRVSQFRTEDVRFEALWERLGRNKLENEKRGDQG